MFVIVTKGKDDQTAMAALPIEVQKEIVRVMKEGKNRDQWVSVGLANEVRLEVNIARAQIKEATGFERKYRLEHYISRKLFSDPYEVTEPVKFEGNVFHVISGGTEETVTVTEDPKSSVISRDTLVLKSGTERLMYFDKDDGAFVSNGELYTVPDPQRPYVIVMNGEERTVAHGEFLWLYDTSPPDRPNDRETHFHARPYDWETSFMLEEAMLKGRESADFELKTYDGETRIYTVNLVNRKMYQYRRDAPNYARRVWRIGTDIKPKLKEYWSYTHKLRNLTVDLPGYWRNEEGGNSQFYPVDLTSSEGQKVLAIVKSSIERYEDKTPLLGFGGKWLEASQLEQSTTAGNPVHFVTESGDVRREKPCAIHIAGLYRIEKHDQFLSYCAGKNSIINRRDRLTSEPSHRRATLQTTHWRQGRFLMRG